MKLNLFERDGKKLVQGIVVSKTPGRGSAEGRVLNVKIKANVWDATAKAEKETTMDIAFWNTDTRKLADDANARLEVDKYISVLVTEKDGKYSASAFKKQGIWRFPETLDDTGSVKNNEANVIIGLVVNGYPSEDGSRYRVSIPVTTYDADNKPVSEWIPVTFFSSEQQPQLPVNAQKVLQPFTPEGSETPIRHKVAIRCGAKSFYPDKNNGPDRVSYTGYSFDRLD